MSSPIAAQVTFDGAPTSYSIDRFPTRDELYLLLPAPITVTGGETVTITVRLPEPLGIDLARARYFDTYMELLNTAACSPGGDCAVGIPFFNGLPAVVEYFTAAGDDVPPFATVQYFEAGAATLPNTAQLGRANIERTDYQPFTSQFASLSQIRASFVVPAFYQTTTGFQLFVWLTAARNATDTAPVLVQGKDVGILQVVADTVAALQQAGVDPATVLELAAELRTALESIAEGDYAVGARQLNDFFKEIDALVDAGALSATAARELRQAILKQAAVLRSR